MARPSAARLSMVRQWDSRRQGCSWSGGRGRNVGGQAVGGYAGGEETCALPRHSEGQRDDRRVQDGRVAQWITRLPTEQKIPGLNHGALDYLFFYVFTRSTLILYGCHSEQPASSVCHVSTSLHICHSFT